MRKRKVNFKRFKKEYPNGNVYHWSGQKIPIIFGWKRKYYIDDFYESKRIRENFLMQIEKVFVIKDKGLAVVGIVHSGNIEIGDFVGLQFSHLKYKVSDKQKLKKPYISICLKNASEKEIRQGKIITNINN